MGRETGAAALKLPGELFDHHIHSTRSDGSVPLASRGATNREVRPHGISDHFPYRGSLQTDDDVLRYGEEASGLGLRVGIEYDLGVAPPLRPSTRAALDYVIGSVHQVHRAGQRIGYDAAGAYLKSRHTGPFADRARFADPDLHRFVLEETLVIVHDGFERCGIDILGHPTFTPLAALGDPEASYPVEWQERLIALCVAHDVAIEVNEAYGVPHRAFLIRARAAGARFSVGSDTHGPLGPLDRTSAMIEEASLDPDRFLDGGRSHPPR